MCVVDGWMEGVTGIVCVVDGGMNVSSSLLEFVVW